MADSARMSALQKLSASLPVANQKVAKQQQAARDIQLQQAVQKAAPATATTAMSQSTGTALAQQAGQQQVQNVQNQQQQQQQVGQLGLEAQGQQLAGRTASLQAGAREQELAGAQKLAQISEQAKQEMYDSRRQFAQDEMGRKFTNDRQMADYARLTARSEQEFQKFQQQSEQVYARKQQMLEAARAKISQQLQYESQLLNQYKDQASRKDISAAEQQNAQRLYEQKLKLRNQLLYNEDTAARAAERAAARKKNRQAAWQAGGTIVGAVIGGVVAGGASGGTAAPAGVAVGGAIGGAVGGLVGSQVEK